MATREAAIAEIESLREQIERHNYLYYGLDSPEITDREYDQLMNKLILLEKEFPDLQTADSPTKRVGVEALPFFNNIKHIIALLSLDNAHSEAQLLDFNNRIQKGLDIQKELEYTTELKIDGLTVALEYEQGLLKTAATRGNGYEGEDVISNIKTIRSIPMRLPVPLNIGIRGEVYIKI